MSIYINHVTNDISTNSGGKPTVGGVAVSKFSPLVSGMRNAKMNVTTASATATFTADEIVVKTALGGEAYVLSSYSEAINLATTGAGGMDTGTAPVSGYVALYAIYNPTTGVDSILATNATSSAAPEIYGGANMPAGYTANALIGVWPTNASSQFVVGYQKHRKIVGLQTSVYTSAVAAGPMALLSIASAVPKNAKMCGGQYQFGNGGSAGIVSGAVGSDTSGAGYQIGAGYITTTAGLNFAWTFDDLIMPTEQTIYITVSNALSSTYSIYIDSYTF